MKHKIFTLTLLALAFVLGCTHDKPVEPLAPAVQQSKYDQADLEVIRDLQKLDAEMELRLAKSASGKVELADGSVDGLAAAIAAAGRAAPFSSSPASIANPVPSRSRSQSQLSASRTPTWWSIPNRSRRRSFRLFISSTLPT